VVASDLRKLGRKKWVVGESNVVNSARGTRMWVNESEGMDRSRYVNS